MNTAALKLDYPPQWAQNRRIGQLDLEHVGVVGSQMKQSDDTAGCTKEFRGPMVDLQMAQTDQPAR